MVDCPSHSTLAQRIADLRQTIPAHVQLIAVSKTVPASLIREAYAAGIRDFGESRLQEAIAKQLELQDLKDIVWHFIGHLQSNKVKPALEHFQWFHSVDSWALAERMNQLATACEHKPKVCLQVKLRDDPSKFGWTQPQLEEALPQLQTLEHLDLRGLMTILPLGLSPSQQLSVFEDLKSLAQTLQFQSNGHLTLPELSMGMSSDYPLAIQAGATMIRLGTILFGQRK
ncbi:MAG TPA: YggS family pyridoxal phosphate-dependent enzyme [Stenomitos sp.]